MQIPLKSSEPQQDDCHARADCAERMLEMTTRHDMAEMWKVIQGIGEAADKRGEQMIKYTNAAKQFFEGMKPS